LAGSSCETNVRFVRQSVKRIGSKVVMEVVRPERSAQVAVPFASSKLTFNVSRPEMNIVLPVAQLLPSVGSPAPCPSGAGAAKFAYAGAAPAETGGGVSTCDVTTSARPLY
jgi:hypothetical protein